MEYDLKFFIVLGTLAPIGGALAWNVLSWFRSAREVVGGLRKLPPPEGKGAEVIRLYPKRD